MSSLDRPHPGFNRPVDATPATPATSASSGCIRTRAVAPVLAALVLSLSPWAANRAAAAQATASPPKTVGLQAPSAAQAPAVTPGQPSAFSSHEGVVEAVRQTAIAAQVSAAILELRVQAGDRVAAGQVLARLDARSAAQNASASQAQVAAAQAQVRIAAQDLERKRQLVDKGFISRAGLDQAEATHAAAVAQARAAQAQSGAAGTQAGFYVLRAPYAGVVSALHATQGDMAMPGRPLMTVYDPSQLRVTAAVPVSQLPPGALPGPATVRIDLGQNGRGLPPLTPTAVELLPVVDGPSMTRTLRATLAASDARGLAPGQFARVLWMGEATAGGAPSATAPAAGSIAARDGTHGPRLSVPQSAIVRRSELTAVYVVRPDGSTQLRQVRLGPTLGDRVEVLAGIDPGERVLALPLKAQPK